jgi:hypothetical protein
VNLGGKAIHFLLGGSFDLDCVGHLIVPFFQIFPERTGWFVSPFLDRSEIDQIVPDSPILDETEQHKLPLAFWQGSDRGEKIFG